MHHKFILPALMDAILKLHKYGFDVCAVVCDGASANLTVIKELTGSDTKAFGYVYAHITCYSNFISFFIVVIKRIVRTD